MSALFSPRYGSVLGALMLCASATRCERHASPTVEPERGTAATSAQGPAAGAPGAEVVTGPRVVLHPTSGPAITVRVEVMRTHAQRERGLMFRREMAPLAGMLFVFNRAEHQAFWMHNTILPLDMVFVTADRTVLGIVQNATPMTDDARQVQGDSQYVLELNAGFAQRYHLAAGSTVEMLEVPPAME